MYFDDSHTEVKVTDVTHCDLETKSILKPPKARAPLQEVDLGNQITVEFDVIRKRRVSFAGVNKIKEFNSEAKSFSICSTPAYEEKVSTSSDSSALSTSVSGNINTLTKENDITILDDTMDLTDLSIVQASAMDITGIKPQKPLQGVPDIFAPRCQDSDLFNNQQDVNRQILACEINNLNVKDGLGPKPFQSKPEELNKPEDPPLALDPRKMLLNELLEESAVDCSVDNFLKANKLFGQINCNEREIKKPPLEVCEMDFTQALADPVKSEAHQVQPVLEKKDLDSQQIRTKITSSKPSNLFGFLDMSMEQSNKLQENVMGMEYPQPSQNQIQTHMFTNFNSDESKLKKIDASQMEFTEALPSKNINLAQNSVASNYIGDKFLARPNSLHEEQPNSVQNMVQMHLNFNPNYNESKSGNGNVSQMEFTEALPSKNIVQQNFFGHIHNTASHFGIEKTKPLQKSLPSHMISNINVDESRSGNHSASQMEFTEALPSRNIVRQNLVDSNHTSFSASQRQHPNHFQKSMPGHIIPNFNNDESRTQNINASQMEFTEALPSRNIVCQNLVANGLTTSSVSQKENLNHLQNSKPGHIMDDSRARNSNVSLMEFTEVLPSKNLVHQNSVAYDHTRSAVPQVEHSKVFPNSMPNHMIPNFNLDESRARNSNASQMEFTEALPSRNIVHQNLVAKDHNRSSVFLMEHPKQFQNPMSNQLFPNSNIDESRVRNTNASQMEFTEAIPSKNIVCHAMVANVQITTSVSQIEYSKPCQKLMPSHAIPNINVDELRTSKMGNASQMEFTALPSRNLVPPNFNNDGFEQAKNNNTTQMELTALQNVNPAVNNIVASNYIGNRLAVRNINSHLNKARNDLIPNFDTDETKSVKCNDVSLKQFIGTLSAETPRNNVIASNHIGERLEENTNLSEAAHNIITSNILPKTNISQMSHSNPSRNMMQNDMISNININKFILSESNNASQMEFTEALPPKKLPNINIASSNYSNISPMEDLKINLNTEKLISNNYLLSQADGNFEEVGELSQMELTEAVPMLNKRQSIANFACNSTGFQRITSGKNIILDRENIPPSQDLNESNSMDVTEIDFADSENGRHIVHSEQNAKVNINKNVLIDDSKLSDKRLINQVDASNMDLTGLPKNFLSSDGKMGQQIFDNNGMTKKYVLPASGVDDILGNSSCMEFTSALPSHKEFGKNVPNLVQNVSPDVKVETLNKLNISNTMDITEIDHDNIVGDLKENINVAVSNVDKLIIQPTFDLEESVFKDVSQMEFTEALPARKIQTSLNPARQPNLEFETSSKTKISPNHNLQTSNMEFTEVLPTFNLKQAAVNSQGVCRNISPSHEILQNKIISSEQNLNNSCSMDVTDVENVPKHDFLKNVKVCSDFPKPEIKEKLDDEPHTNPQNVPFLFGSHSNFVTERKTSKESENDFSHLEFTEALPVINELDGIKMVKDTYSVENPLVNKKMSITESHENGSIDSSNMEFTEFIRKPDAHDFIFGSENQEKERTKDENQIKYNVTSLENKENLDYLSSDDLIRTKNVPKNDKVQKTDEIYTKESYNKYDGDELVKTKNNQVDKAQMEFLHNLKQSSKLPSRPNGSMLPVTNQLVDSSFDATQMDFTEAMQPQIQPKDNIKLLENNEFVSEKISDEVVSVKKIPDASQVELVEAITSPACRHNSVENSKTSPSKSEEVFGPTDENNLNLFPLDPSDKANNISMNENESEIKDRICEDVKMVAIDHIQKSENNRYRDHSQPKNSEHEIEKRSHEVCKNIDNLEVKLETPIHTSMEFDHSKKRDEDSIKGSSCKILSGKDYVPESADLSNLKNESVSSAQNLGLLSPMHVDEPSISTTEKKDNKVNSLRKLFEKESKSDNITADFNTPKGKQSLGIRSGEGSNYENNNNSKSASTMVEMLTVEDASKKKNLVHFNTPPVRIMKRRKTMGPLNPEDSAQLLQSSVSDLASPLQDISSAFNHQNASQRRGIFDEKKKPDYDPDKGKEEWDRLVKNDAFMKERSFRFINPCKWKYQFRWPMELILEIPDIEVNDNSRKKNISLVSKIFDSDHISVFINNRMKKNMSVILSEKWLNSHCKTIKDLLFTIKFIEEEYNKLEPLISSMKYFYEEFPFDFSSDRIVFTIVNLRKEFCFEVKIDVSYGQVKGKNIEVINHVGEISKTKVQQLFDQLPPSTERFYLFWQKLMNIQEL